MHPEDDALQPFPKDERVVPMRKEDAATFDLGAQGSTSRMGQGEPRTRVVRPHLDLDEKWFYITSSGGRLKMPAGEERPKTRLKSKRFVGKIMVLTAVTRPRGNFNGILGSWRVLAKPFI